MTRPVGHVDVGNGVGPANERGRRPYDSGGQLPHRDEEVEVAPADGAFERSEDPAGVVILALYEIRLAVETERDVSARNAVPEVDGSASEVGVRLETKATGVRDPTPDQFAGDVDRDRQRRCVVGPKDISDEHGKVGRAPHHRAECVLDAEAIDINEEAGDGDRVVAMLAGDEHRGEPVADAVGRWQVRPTCGGGEPLAPTGADPTAEYRSLGSGGVILAGHLSHQPCRHTRGDAEAPRHLFRSQTSGS